MIGVADMSEVHACERLLPVVGQFAAEQIHQQPVREAAVAPRPYCRRAPLRCCREAYWRQDQRPWPNVTRAGQAQY